MLMRYLIIGISFYLFICCNSSSSEPDPGFDYTTYTYKNESDFSIELKIYNANNEVIKEYSIPVNESISIPLIERVGTSIINPFKFGNDTSLIGKKVLMTYNNIKCIENLFSQGKIFDYTTYDNYSDLMLHIYVKELIYTFDNNDYNLATDCP